MPIDVKMRSAACGRGCVGLCLGRGLRPTGVRVAFVEELVDLAHSSRVGKHGSRYMRNLGALHPQSEGMSTSVITTSCSLATG